MYLIIKTLQKYTKIMRKKKLTYFLTRSNISLTFNNMTLASLTVIKDAPIKGSSSV